MAPADAQLVQRTLAGDLEGFGELHRRYYERVVRVISGIVKDRVQAEDMVQDAYICALEALPRLSDGNRFYPWLCRIAVNRAVEALRQASSRDRLHASWTEWGAGDAAATADLGGVLDQLEDAQRADAVRSALDRLPEGQRAAVVLRFFDALPMRQISEILGCEEVTARTQVFRGLQKLGRLLSDLAPDNDER